MSNPLLQKFKSKHTTAPFSKIKNEHFKPAFKCNKIYRKKKERKKKNGRENRGLLAL